jgi:hypothetical protein
LSENRVGSNGSDTRWKGFGPQSGHTDLFIISLGKVLTHMRSGTQSTSSLVIGGLIRIIATAGEIDISGAGSQVRRMNVW